MKELLKILLLSFGLCSNVMAQDINVTGKVTSAGDNLPIPGANVSIKGEAMNTVTDSDGRYNIKVKSATATLVFSFVGFTAESRPVGNSQVINVALTEESSKLNEVVVTALGIKKEKKSLTYSTQTVSTSEISKARELNVANSLSGKVAGMDVTRSSSGLGGSSRITLRGERSITGNNQALVVVDGVPIDNSTGGASTLRGGRDLGDGISSINPDDIESINVLKGASATALYGSRAANGALIITTKKGKSGSGLGISYSLSEQIEQPIFLQKLQNEYGQGSANVYSPSSETSWGPRLDGSQVPTWSRNPADAGKTLSYAAQPNNYKDFYGNGNNLVNSISLNGGIGTVQTYFSYTNTNAKGIIDNNTLKRNNLNLRINNQFGEKLSLDAKVTYLNEIINNRPRTGETPDNPNRNIIGLPRNIATADLENFEYTTETGFVRQNYFFPGTNGGSNPYWTKNRNLNLDERNRITSFASLTYKFLPSLNLMVRYGLDRYTDAGESKWYNDSYIVAPTGNYQVINRDVQETNSDFLLSYDKKLGSNFSVNANFGGNIQKNKIINVNTNNGSLIIENLFITNNASGSATNRSISRREKQSLYATTDLGYKGYLNLTLTARNDWASTLSAKNNSYFFPSAGLSLVVSEMTTLPSFISFAKIRGSLAQTGNDAPAYSLTQTYTAFAGGNGVTIGRDDRKPIDDLKPELTSAQEVGVDVRFFKNRFGAEFTWYNSNSKNQLLPVALPPGSGWLTEFINAGNVKNSGIEIALNATAVKTNSFTWDLAVNYAKNKNKVVEITPELNELALTGSGDFMNLVKAVKGRPFGELYSRGYTRNADGRIVVDAAGLPVITGGQTIYVGNTRPDWTGSVINKFSYKGIFASFVISARIGGVVSSFTNANIYGSGIAAETALNRDGFVFDGVKADGSPNNVSVTAEQYWRRVGGRNSPAGEVFTYSASNIRMREMVLGYNLPKKVFKGLPIQTASFSLTGRNLFFLMNKAKGFDPEVVVSSDNIAVGVEAFSPPTTRSIGLNLNLTF